MGYVGIALTSLIGAMTAAMWGYLVRFVREQREVNRATAMANRSLQKAQLIQLFNKAVERDEELTLDEFNVGRDCYMAYHANGGNGAGTQMWERIEEHARIKTGL